MWWITDHVDSMFWLEIILNFTPALRCVLRGIQISHDVQNYSVHRLTISNSSAERRVRCNEDIQHLRVSWQCLSTHWTMQCIDGFQIWLCIERNVLPHRSQTKLKGKRLHITTNLSIFSCDRFLMILCFRLLLSCAILTSCPILAKNNLCAIQISFSSNCTFEAHPDLYSLSDSVSIRQRVFRETAQ